jgi:hypothetical protein
MNPLVLSTIPHYLSIIPLISQYKRYNQYIAVICISTTLSALWHYKSEPRGIILYADYLFASIWAAIEAYYIKESIILNAAILYMNININKDNRYYIIQHSAWHLLNATKAFYIAVKCLSAT